MVFSNINITTWKVISLASSITAIGFAIGMSVSLGFLLHNKDLVSSLQCQHPPSHDTAAWNYNGTNNLLSIITYTCPNNLVFPDGKHVFNITCLENGAWDRTELPNCTKSGEVICEIEQPEDSIKLVMYIQDDGISTTFQTYIDFPLPNFMYFNIWKNDSKTCGYKQDENEIPVKEMFNIQVESKEIYPEKEYLISIRGTTSQISLSLIQEETTEVFIFPTFEIQ